ncbi:pali-domain-containing protein [Auricularia subglabra TFB-10046 SS5]|nr:pali-domain-containing protein [Auricularia subglabra TFB-10046 SS5]
MGLRPATPGFIVTLAATICLALVVFSVPWLKSVFFLQAHINSNGVNGTITLGVLGYCLDIGAGDQCSKPSVGYEFDPNVVLGITNRIDIPNVVVKWITYALVLHVVALVLAAVSALFGLLAHVREMSMVCCSNCFSGFAASMALIAFIFDIAFFFLVRSRINAVGGQAAIGTGIWLTLAAWVLLFFASCFYGFGQCCLRRRPRVPGQSGGRTGSEHYTPPYTKPDQSPGTDPMRMDAIKAEQERKHRQRPTEGGLPAFAEYESKPLRTHFVEESDEEDVPQQPYRDGAEPRRQPTMPAAAVAAGYTPAPKGTSAMDEYYSPSRQPQPQPPVSYPPSRQWSQTQQPSHAQIASHYPEIVEPQPVLAPAPPPSTTPAPAVGHALFAGYGGYGSGHDQYLSTATNAQGYGHEARGTSYHSAHSYFPSEYANNGYGHPASPPPNMYQQPQQSSSFPQPSAYLPAGAQQPQPTPAESYYTANASTPSGYTPTPPAILQPGYRDSGATDSSYYSQATPTMPQPPQSASSLPYALTPGRGNASGPPTPSFAGQQRQGSVPQPPRGPRSPTSPTSPTGWPNRRSSVTPSDLPPSYEGPSSSAYHAPPEKS